MQCTNNTKIELETAELSLKKIKLHHQCLTFSYAISILVSLGITYQYSLVALIPFALSFLLLAVNINLQKATIAEITMNYIKALGTDKFLSSTDVPAPLLASINSRLKMENTLSFSEMYAKSSQKTINEKLILNEVILDSSFRRNLF